MISILKMIIVLIVMSPIYVLIYEGVKDLVKEVKEEIRR